jgi:hypothetical protein
MGKNAPWLYTKRFCVMGFAVAASATLAFPGSAFADDTLSGSCATTLEGARAQGLTLDLGAPLNVPGTLTVGLDGRNSAARQEGAPLLSLPVGDVVRGLGVGKVPVVTEACNGAQGVVNTVGNTTQGLLGGDQPGDPGQPPTEPGDPGTPPTSPGTPPTNPGGPGNEIDPVVTGPNGDLDAISGVFISAAFVPGGLGAPVIIPIVPPGQAPIVGEAGAPPVVVADRSGTAEALPASNAPARLPLLLAVLALAIVAAALIRTWLRRNPA